MGNTIRHSLGHMCGGESSKDCQENGSERPIERPKESKKKKKKNKKNKKARNGKLGSIEEENVEPTNLPNGKGQLSSSEGEDKSQEGFDESWKHEDIPDKDELHINAESSNLPVITIDCASDSMSMQDEKTLLEVSHDIPVGDSYINGNEQENDGYGDGDSVSLISTNEEHVLSIIVCSFKPIKTETLGIEAADEIFVEAFTSYTSFLDGGNMFKDAILEFQQSVEPEKKSTDFVALWHLYKETEEAIGKNSAGDVSIDLTAMKSAGSALLHIIPSVKRILTKCCDEAKNIDAIECAKDKMLGGEELMTTGKFSAPGKYRRNMNRLKKCTKQINEIELETYKILRCFGTMEPIEALPPTRESIIFAEQKSTDQDLDDIFSNLSQESIPIVLSECDENTLDHDFGGERPTTPLPTVDLLVSPDVSSDNEVDNVFSNVYHENDDAYQDSIQVSKEIPNSNGLDFHIISTNIQEPNDSLGYDEDDSHTLPQVHLHKNNFVPSVDGDKCHDVESILPGVEGESNKPSSLSMSYDGQMDFLPDNIVSVISVENQTPPLSINIVQPVNADDDHCAEDEIIATEESVLKDCNKSNFEEIFNCDSGGEPADFSNGENISMDIIMSNESYDQVHIENTQDISKANPLYSKPEGDCEGTIVPVNEFEQESDDSGIDYINISGYTTSSPQTKQNPSDCLSDDSGGIVMCDVAYDSDELTHLNMPGMERIKEQDTAVISISSKSDASPDILNISSTKVTFGGDVNDITEGQLLHSGSSLSAKGISIASKEEVDVALMVLQEAISSDDIQDDFVDLLCSSISRVLGDEVEKSPIIKLNSKSSSFNSSYEEGTLHKSFQHSKEVIDWVGTHFKSSESYSNDNVDTIKQCIIVPVDKDSVHSPIIISHTIFKSENYTKDYDARGHITTVNVSLDNVTASDSIDNKPPTDIVQTFVIKSIPETMERNGAVRYNCPTPPTEIDVELDHNTLDYGNYVFVDPSTGDIQVMRNRSRSLDSLVSMASSRSSISRFGSFEFVTDFEINIAEKNQEMMKVH